MKRKMMILLIVLLALILVPLAWGVFNWISVSPPRAAK